MRGFPGGTVVKNLPANAGDARDTSLIPGSGRSPGGEDGNPLQDSCLEKPMDRGAWWATVHGVVKSKTRLRDLAGTQMQIIKTPRFKFISYCQDFTLFMSSINSLLLRPKEKKKNKNKSISQSNKILINF